MPRGPRLKSPSGILHVMVRGVGKMDIFPYDSDKYVYLDYIGKIKEEMKFELLAYCLMSNHAHLLLKDDVDCLSLAMKRIGICYAQYFNKCYQRVGHVFQGRFKSQTIENPRQCVICARYIHNNPVRAGIVTKAERYPWSSYNAYLSPNKSTLINPELILGEHGKDPQVARKALIEFTQTMDSENHSFLTSDAGLSPAEKIVAFLNQKGLTLAAYKQLHKEERNDLIRALRAATAASIRDLEAALDMSKSAIARILRK